MMTVIIKTNITKGLPWQFALLIYDIFPWRHSLKHKPIWMRAAHPGSPYQCFLSPCPRFFLPVFTSPTSSLQPPTSSTLRKSPSAWYALHRRSWGDKWHLNSSHAGSSMARSMINGKSSLWATDANENEERLETGPGAACNGAHCHSCKRSLRGRSEN